MRKELVLVCSGFFLTMSALVFQACGTGEQVFKCDTGEDNETSCGDFAAPHEDCSVLTSGIGPFKKPAACVGCAEMSVKVYHGKRQKCHDQNDASGTREQCADAGCTKCKESTAWRFKDCSSINVKDPEQLGNCGGPCGYNISI